MHSFRLQSRTLSFVILLGLLPARILAAADEPALSKEQIKRFLLTAKVIKSVPAHKSVTTLCGSR
jgi:hypothetical protein